MLNDNNHNRFHLKGLSHKFEFHSLLIKDERAQHSTQQTIIKDENLNFLLSCVCVM